ncbi:MAG TPA: thiamine pyrophosphate-dependent enzyme [Syntrophales bacterium]|nr:thiamine pyrophosphate-dependent enzyme [Syntrophales bacterium]
MAENKFDFAHKIDMAWCPGCSNFSIRRSLLAALDELGVAREKVVMVSGIGQAAKMPQYINTNFFNGLHGRALPAATAVKACNPGLTVIAEGGDGDMYGEGGNHFLHATRRNPDIALFVHDNMVYGLTKGQASPTTREGMVTPVQTAGVFEKPVNPVALAVALDVPFVARAFSADWEKTRDIMKQAILHRGFSLVDIFQPCISFNKVNTYSWYKDNSYYLKEDYDPTNKTAAFAKAQEELPFPLGVIYLNSERVPFEDHLPLYAHDKRPLYERERALEKIAAILKSRV